MISVWQETALFCINITKATDGTHFMKITGMPEGMGYFRRLPSEIAMNQARRVEFGSGAQGNPNPQGRLENRKQVLTLLRKHYGLGVTGQSVLVLLADLRMPHLDLADKQYDQAVHQYRERLVRYRQPGVKGFLRRWFTWEPKPPQFPEPELKLFDVCLTLARDVLKPYQREQGFMTPRRVQCAVKALQELQAAGLIAFRETLKDVYIMSPLNPNTVRFTPEGRKLLASGLLNTLHWPSGQKDH